MSNLQRYNSDDIELVIDNTTGEAFATERGYALMSGLSQQAVNKRTRKPDNQTIVKKAETLTTQGLRTNNLIPADTVFLWLMKDNPELAVKMGQVGATIYLHQLAGYKVNSTAIEKPLDHVSTLKQLLGAAEQMLAVREQGQLMPGFGMLTDAAIQGLPDNDIPMSLDEWLLALDIYLSPSELGYVRQGVVSAYVAMYHRKPAVRQSSTPVMGKKGKMVKGNFQSVCVYPPSALPLIQSVLETVGTQPVG